MLSHHAEVYKKLQADYPDADVFIGTSDKVEGDRSPFSFEDKEKIAEAHGINSNNVLQAKSPYVWNFYKDYFDTQNTVVFFAVGEKDMQDDPRFTFDNIDSKTGLNMKSNNEPYYYQMINTYNSEDPVSMEQRGYILEVPNVLTGDEVASASAFRNALKTAPSIENAKEIFTKQFGEYNEEVFKLVYSKIAGEINMKEEMKILRKLAGLSEDAPVEFEADLKPEDVEFAPVSKSSSKMSIANRFPEGSDVNDKDVKREEFINALMKSPASLLSEINERIKPDENGLEVSKKLSDIIDNLGDKGLMGLGKDDKGFVVEIVKVAIEDMDLEAGDDSEPEYQPDPEEDDLDKITNPLDKGALETIDLSSIKDEYEVDEGKVKDMAMDMVEKFYDKVAGLVDDNNDLGKAVVDAWNDEEQNPPEYMLDDEVQDILVDAGLIEPEQQEPAELGEKYQYANTEEKLQDMIDTHQYKIDNNHPEEINVQDHEDAIGWYEGLLDQHKKTGEDKFEAPQGGDTAWREMIWQEMEDVGLYKPHGLGDLRGVDNLPEDAEMAEMRKLAGLESFDPRAEQSREEEAYEELTDVYAKGGEEALAKELTLSMKELDDEMSEWARDHNLHMDDDRDEIIHGYIEDLVDNADWKDHGGMDYDPADMEMEEGVVDNQMGLKVYNDKSPLSYSDWYKEWTNETGEYNADPDELKRMYNDYLKAVKKSPDYSPGKEFEPSSDDTDYVDLFRKVIK